MNVLRANFLRHKRAYVKSRARLTARLNGKLTPEQYIILSQIPPDGCSMYELGKLTCTLGPSLSRTIPTLVALELVTTEGHAKDARLKMVKLTPPAITLLQFIEENC